MSIFPTLPIIVPGILPPSREVWESVVFYSQFAPLITIVQSLISYHAMGKRAIESEWNIPGKVAWTIMEVPGFLVLLYCVNTLPVQEGIASLPGTNKLLTGLYVWRPKTLAFDHY